MYNKEKFTYLVVFLAILVLIVLSLSSGSSNSALEYRISQLENESQYYARYETGLDASTLDGSTDLTPGVIYQASDDDKVYFSNSDGTPQKSVSESSSGTQEQDAPISIPDDAIVAADVSFEANTINNYNPTGFDSAVLIEFTNSSGGNKNITGFPAPSVNKIIKLFNNGPDNIRLKNQNTNSAVGNRIANPNGTTNFVLNADEYVEIYYSLTSSEWKVLSN